MVQEEHHRRKLTFSGKAKMASNSVFVSVLLQYSSFSKHSATCPNNSNCAQAVQLLYLIIFVCSSTWYVQPSFPPGTLTLCISKTGDLICSFTISCLCYLKVMMTYSFNLCHYHLTKLLTSLDFINGETVYYSAYQFNFFFPFFRLNEGDAYYALKDFALLIKSVGYDKLVLFNIKHLIFKPT